MKFIIPGSNIKVFGRAIHALAKIGEDLYFESSLNNLSIKTVNSSRSAFASYTFQRGFFIPDGFGDATNDSSPDDNNIRCKITAKSCLTAFKSLNSLEKTVLKCKVSIDLDASRFIFQFYYHHGMLKTHRLTFIECDTLMAVFTRDTCQNSVKAHVRLLCDAVNNFQQQQEEVTLVATGDSLTLKNYADDEPDPAKVIRTELSLLKEEFDSYKINQQADITFCLKELRAVLSFAEATGVPVSIHFDTAGRPAIVSLQGDTKYEANFVLATLAPPSNSQSQTINGVSQSTSRNNGPVDEAGSNRDTSAKVLAANGDAEMQEDETVNELHQNLDDRPLPPVASVAPSPLLSLVLPTASRDAETNQTDAPEEDEDIIPGTPPSKKFRSIFFGLSQATLRTSQYASRTILAEDTDEEDT